MVLLPESRISSHLGLNVIEEKPEDDQSPTEVEQKPADPKVAAATNVGVGIPLLSITGTYYIRKGLDRQKYHRRIVICLVARTQLILEFPSQSSYISASSTDESKQLVIDDHIDDAKKENECGNSQGGVFVQPDRALLFLT